MNDFTKEELEIIKHGIDCIFENQDFKDKPPILTFGRKIQAMIENYCKHEPRGDFHECVERCNICGMIIDE